MRKIIPQAHIEPEFEYVRKRTDPEMRSLYELCLHATIVTCNEELCLQTLRYGRMNTFLMVMQQNWLSTALSYFPSYLQRSAPPVILTYLFLNHAVYHKPMSDGTDEANNFLQMIAGEITPKDREPDEEHDVLAQSWTALSIANEQEKKQSRKDKKRQQMKFKNLDASDLVDQMLFEMREYPNTWDFYELKMLL